jgi:dihydrolipoamide dehydrogenase
MSHYQLAVIGTGPGGYIAALEAAQMGASVAVVEKQNLGGTCLNFGCIPSKALLSAAELLHQVRHAGDWGLKVGAPVSADWPAIQQRKDKVVRGLRGGIASLFKGRGVTLYPGHARLDGPGRIVVTADQGTQTLSADHVVIASGSVPVRIPGWPADPLLVCTSDEAVHWKDLPGKLLIVGGGVIGCEFACMMQAFGVEVTVVEMLPELLPTPGLDRDLGQALRGIFTKRGITCHVATKVSQIQTSAGGVAAVLSNGQTVEADRVLVSVGRAPNTKELGLASVGIPTSPKGFITVDDTMATPVKGYWCIGDANGRCLLAHAASAHAAVAVQNALGHARTFTDPVPSAVYTFPEIGAVGLSEQDAAVQGIPVAIGKFPLAHLGKAMAANHTDGFVKVLRHRETGALLGVHMLGHNATECIAAAGALLHQKATVRDVAEMVFAHPTISEAIKESAQDALGIALHLPPRKPIRVPAGA